MRYSVTSGPGNSCSQFQEIPVEVTEIFHGVSGVFQEISGGERLHGISGGYRESTERFILLKRS